MADNVSITVNDRQVKRALAKVIRRLENTNGLFKEIALTLKGNTLLRFREEVDPDGVAWKPLSNYTRQRKRDKGSASKNKILQDSGVLLQSIISKNTARSATVGTNLSYALKHQLGLGVPKREFIGLNKRDVSDVLETIKTYIKESVS